MSDNNNDFLVKDTQLIPYEELVNIVNGFRDQLQSLDYRVTNKNFGSKLYQTKETINSKSRFVAGADDEVVIMDAQNPTYRLWAGAKDPAAAPFSVDKFGNLIANSVTLSGYLQVGEALSDIGTGNITSTYIGSNAITTAKLATEAVTAVKIDVDDLFAQNITASGTITGARLRTASSGTRVEMSVTDNSFKIYQASDLRMELYQDRMTFYDDAGGDVLSFYASPTGNFLMAGTASNDLLFSSERDFTISVADDFTILSNDTITLQTGALADDIYLGLGANTFIQLGDGRVYFDTYIDMNANDITDGGDITCVSLTETSDIRRKKNIRPLSYGLKEVLKLEPIQFQFKKQVRKAKEGRRIKDSFVEPEEKLNRKASVTHLGFSAQEVFKIMPELTENADGVTEETARLYTTQMIPVLVRAIQELYTEVKTLQK